MKIPSEWVLLADVERSLLNKNLSLPQVHEAEALLINSTVKTTQLASGLFEQVETWKGSLMDREVEISKEAFLVASEVALLRLQMPSLTFEEAAEKILELGERVECLSKTAPSTHRLQEAIERSRAEIEHLHFVFVFPLLDELEGDSFLLNMSHFLSHVAEELCKTESFEAFEKLSVRQQEEIRKLVGFGVSPEGLAHGIELYHKSLLAQSHAAESYFHGRESADREFELLPEEVRSRVEHLEQFDVLRTEALMQSLEERMDF